jgi:hypothetical protein
MRGCYSNTEALFSYMTPEPFVSKDHLLRAIRKMSNEALAWMDKLLTAGMPQLADRRFHLRSC